MTAVGALSECGVGRGCSAPHRWRKRAEAGSAETEFSCHCPDRVPAFRGQPGTPRAGGVDDRAVSERCQVLDDLPGAVLVIDDRARYAADLPADEGEPVSVGQLADLLVGHAAGGDHETVHRPAQALDVGGLEVRGFLGVGQDERAARSAGLLLGTSDDA